MIKVVSASTGAYPGITGLIVVAQHAVAVYGAPDVAPGEEDYGNDVYADKLHA